MRRSIIISVFAAGFTAMVSQIVFMRELFTVFCGNELSIGFMLASWLVGGAIGSALLGRFADRARSGVNLFLICQILLCLLLPLSIVAIRLVKYALGINPGEMVSLSLIVLSGFIVLLPVSVILGLMFSLSCRLYRSSSVSGASIIGKIYLFESAGAMAGGLLVSFILIKMLSSICIMAMLGVLNIACSLAIPIVFKEVRPRTLFLFISNLALAAIVLMWPFRIWEKLDRYSLGKKWHGYELIASRDSVYGNIALTKSGAEFSFFNNGLRLATIPDTQASEEAVHFALLEHISPKEALIIGGGVGGLADEAMKHPLRKIDYIELDPLIVKMAEEYLPKRCLGFIDDWRVSLINADGRYFIKNTKAKYDCVIVHLGDPQSALMNRFYTVEFFKEVKRVLNAGGIVSFAVTSSEDYMNKELRNFLRSIYATLNKVFSSVKVIPGNTAYFLASDAGDTMTYDYNILMQRARARELNLKYVREYYLFSRLSAQRISCINDILKAGDKIRINYDFRPVAYYYDLVFWASQFRDTIFRWLLGAMTEMKLWGCVFGGSLAVVFLGLAGLRRGAPFRGAVVMTMAISGLSMMAFQILVLLVFQIIYGYLFYKLGFILTSFMIGLVLGSSLALKIMPKIRNDKRAFGLAQCVICVYPLMLAPAFLWLAGAKGDAAVWLGANVIFPLLSVMAGFAGGFQFPLANKIYLGRDDGLARTAGIMYGTDLAGSCLGAILTGTFFIPLTGVINTCLALAMVNFSALIALVLSGARKDGGA